MPDYSNQLMDAIRAAWGSPRVEVLGDDRFVVSVPGHRYEHDLVNLVIQRDDSDPERPWLISDDGQTAFLLGERFGQLADVLRDSPVVSGDFRSDQIVLRSAGDAIGEAAVSFAHDLGSLLVSANVLDAYIAARKAARTAATASRVMAREVQAQLARAVPRLKGLYRLDRPLHFSHLHVRAPFALDRTANDKTPPAIVASMVDFTSDQAARYALGTSSLMLDLAEKLHVPQRFVIVRGGAEDEARDLADLYDRENITVSTSTELDVLIRTVAEVEAEIFGSRQPMASGA